MVEATVVLTEEGHVHVLVGQKLVAEIYGPRNTPIDRLTLVMQDAVELGFDVQSNGSDSELVIERFGRSELDGFQDQAGTRAPHATDSK